MNNHAEHGLVAMACTISTTTCTYHSVCSSINISLSVDFLVYIITAQAHITLNMYMDHTQKTRGKSGKLHLHTVCSSKIT